MSLDESNIANVTIENNEIILAVDDRESIQLDVVPMIVINFTAVDLASDNLTVEYS